MAARQPVQETPAQPDLDLVKYDIVQVVLLQSLTHSYFRPSANRSEISGLHTLSKTLGGIPPKGEVQAKITPSAPDPVASTRSHQL